MLPIIPVSVPRLASPYTIILSQKTTGKNDYHAQILTRALYLSTRMSTKYLTLEDAWNAKIARYAYFACNAVWFYSCCFLKHYFIQFSDMDLGRFCLLPRWCGNVYRSSRDVCRHRLCAIQVISYAIRRCVLANKLSLDSSQGWRYTGRLHS